MGLLYSCNTNPCRSRLSGYALGSDLEPEEPLAFPSLVARQPRSLLYDGGENQMYQMGWQWKQSVQPEI